LTNVVAIAAGANQSLALKGNGTVVAWGDDYYGETNVPTGLTNVVAIAAGGYYSLALKGDGTVVAWDDHPGFPTGLTNVVAIAAGWLDSLALKGDGTVVVWGDDGYGETTIPTGLTNVVAIAEGAYHCLALRNDGTVVCWGDDYYGETNVPSGLTNVVAIAGGYRYSLALKSDGTVVGWGFNISGQITTPLGLTNVVAIAAGGSTGNGSTGHSLALGVLQPVIVIQPQSQIAMVGSNVTFNVVATHLPLNYQWYFNGAPLAGANSATLILTNVQPVNTGNYSVNVWNNVGSVFSTAAGLTVVFPPTVNLTSPANGQFFKADPTNLTLTATAGEVNGNIVNVA